MCKFFAFMSLCFLTTIALGMDKKASADNISVSVFGDKRTVIKTFSSVSRIRDRDKYKHTVLSGAVTKPSIQKKEYQSKNHNEKISFIRNDYTARRGEPKMLEIFCSQCHTALMRYQKDGPGRLLRCYLDRIHSPEQLKQRQYKPFNVRTSQKLECGKCYAVVGSPMIYQSEKRPAYQMYSNNFYFNELRLGE